MSCLSVNCAPLRNLQKLDDVFPEKPLYPSDSALAADAEVAAELERDLATAGYRHGQRSGMDAGQTLWLTLLHSWTVRTQAQSALVDITSKHRAQLCGRARTRYGTACCRYLTCRAEGGFAGEIDESRAPEFRAGFEARLAEVETALGKHGGPFFLGCVATVSLLVSDAEDDHNTTMAWH